MDKILIKTKSLYEKEFNNEKFKGGYDDENYEPQIFSFNEFDHEIDYKKHLDKFIEDISLNLQNELFVIGTPVLKLDALHMLHEIIEKRLDEIDNFLNTPTGSFPGNPAFSIIDKSKVNIYVDYSSKELDRITFRNFKVLLSEYYSIQKSALGLLVMKLIKTNNEVIHEIRGKYKEKLPVRSFKWIGYPKKLLELYNSANTFLFETDIDTFLTAFSQDPIRPIIPRKIEWIFTTSEKRKESSKFTLFYFIDCLSKAKLIKEKLLRTVDKKSTNGPVFSMIESFFTLKGQKDIKNLSISFNSYKNTLPTYPEIKKVVDLLKA